MGKLTGAAARTGIVPVLARQLAQLALVDVRDDVGRQEALAHVPQQTYRAGTVTLDAQLGSVIALGLIVAGLRLRALGRRPVTGGTPRALGFLLAGDVRVARNELARVTIAARSLRRTALRTGLPRATLSGGVQPEIYLADNPRIAAPVRTFLVVEPAVTLFTNFNNLITAEGTLRREEAVALLVVFDGVQHVRDVPYRTARELAVVGAVSAGGTGEHNVVPVDATRAALGGVVVR